jgi:hypothetical protein
MSVAKTESSDKAVSENITTTGNQLVHLASELHAFVKSAASSGESFDTVERAVFKSVLEIGRQAMGLFVELQGDGDLGAQVETAGQKTLYRSEQLNCTKIRSIFGVHEFREFTYSAGKKKAVELKPVSARMSLPGHRWSFLLQEFSQMLCVDQAYDQAMTNLSRIFEADFSVDTAEQVNSKMGAAAAEFLDDLPMPDPSTESQLLVASLDCKGVPLVKQDAPRVAAFETPKKRAGNRKMATVATVYTVDCFYRTAEDVVEALFRDPQVDSVKRNRPKPQNKNTTAHFPELEDDGTGGMQPITGIHVGTAWAMAQVDARRRPDQTLIVVMDGQESLWDTVELHLEFNITTVPILDILHVVSAVWSAAKIFETSDSARKDFTRARTLRILKGEVRSVVRGLRQLASCRKLKGERLKDLSQICGYFEKNAERMRYNEYLMLGYPIASGPVEGACGHLVKDRMERSGMRWTLEGARAMLDVRAAFQSDHWQAFLDWQIKNEVASIHPHKNLLSDYAPNALAC